jgi:peroxiredoxin Q/BCP
MKIGDLAPDFELISNTGEWIRLSSYVGKKKVILFFYVKDNTPGCTTEVKGFKDHYKDISEKYELIGINQDSEESRRSFSEKIIYLSNYCQIQTKRLVRHMMQKELLGCTPKG